MSDLTPVLPDAMRLLFDLRQSNEIAEGFSGCLDPIQIAQHVTLGLVERFGCAFARIWLVESDRTSLRLVASAGLYTHVNGSFARVPMGAYKVGKIAQNGVPFLSNNLPEETWVKDREWAIANQIRGFAGYPLAAGDRIVGVLATFSRQTLAPEFLEVLQTLCTTTTIAIDTAQQAQATQSTSPLSIGPPSLSDQLATVLNPIRLNLVGTERRLTPGRAYLFLRLAELLTQTDCHYCRLTYGPTTVVLEAIAACQTETDLLQTTLGELMLTATCLGGELRTQPGSRQMILQIFLTLPYQLPPTRLRVQIRCQSPLWQVALTHLATLAQLQLSVTSQPGVVLITDTWPTDREEQQPILWVQTGATSRPRDCAGQVDSTVTATTLRQAVEALSQGSTWGTEATMDDPNQLSDREREIITGLAQGWRDRDIAQRLHISESTVKFHVNNCLVKLKARNRYQAVYQAAIRNWITLELPSQTAEPGESPWSEVATP